jgi:hypothetical protein
MKTFIIICSFILVITALAVFIQDHTETYQIKGVCKKTLVTYDHRSLSTYYTVIIQYENGDVEDITFRNEGGKDFFKFKENQTYYFNRTKWVW